MTTSQRILLLLSFMATAPLVADEQVSTRQSIEGNPKQEYFLINPSQGEAPKKGYKLLLVLPGGNGSADFHGFITNIAQHAAGKEYLVAQLISVKWTPDQYAIWPTKLNHVKEAKFTTEDFLEAVISEVSGHHKIDPDHIYTLSWSSGGPAAYSASLEVNEIRGSFIAMSVFKPETLPRLSKAKGHRYYLYHSEQDTVCPIRMTRDAEKQLQKHKAKVKFATYKGGHGWHGNIFADIRSGLAWLEDNSTKQ